MSNIVHVICQKRRVGSPTVKAVLMYMSDRAADDGSGIWTSKTTMAADLEMSKRTVQNAIAELISRGLISEAGSRKCDRGFTVDYTINLAAIERLEPTGREAKIRGAGDSPVQEIHPKGCSKFTPRGAGDSPNTSLEPSLNHPKEEGQLSLLPEGQNLPEKIQAKEPDHFAEFWAAYPKCTRKVDRPKAMQLFNRIVAGKHGVIKETDPKIIIAGVKRYAKTDPDPQYIPMPTTWLNGERWISPSGPEDDPDPETAAYRAQMRAITERARAATGQ